MPSGEQTLHVSDIQLRADGGDIALALTPTSGGRWASLRVGDLELLGRGGPRLIDWGNFPMAPYAGRIRHGVVEWGGRRHQLPLDLPPHAVHGVTVDRPWLVTDAGTAHAVLRCDFDTRWPWPGHVIQQVALDAAGVRARLEVHADDEPMPAWTGYHPWFTRRLARGEPARIGLDCDHLLPRDEDGMPSPATVPVASPLPAGPWDDVFGGVRWPATVTWDGALTLEIRSDASHVVVFDEKPDALCVEPQSAPPNAIELGLATVVVPGVPLVMETQFTWH
jgi:aldose 1-epimerase